MHKLLIAILTCATLVLVSSCQPDQKTDANQAVLSPRQQTPQPAEASPQEVSDVDDTDKTADIDERDRPIASDKITDPGELDEPVPSPIISPSQPPKDEPVETEPTETETPQAQPQVKPVAKPAKTDNDKSQQEITPEAILYKKYSTILKTYVDKDGNVNYRTLRRKRRDLFDAVAQLAKLSPSRLVSFASDEQEIVFWVNAHNMLTLKLIVDNYPIKRLFWRTPFYPFDSIKHITGGREKTFFAVTTFQYTLQEIEQVLLDTFNDPRICFALSYVSRSSPLLRNEVYTAEKLDEQLDDQIRKFFRKKTSIKIDRRENIVHLSSVFKLYEKAFIKSKYAKIMRLREKPENIRSYLNFVAEYISKEDARYLRTAKYDVKFMVYDWSLNEQILK
jgi:hypothetical protein